MSAKEAINDKLQGSVATYLRCGGVVNNQIKEDLLLSLWVKKIYNRWIFGIATGRAGFKKGQTGQLPRASTSKGPPQNSKKYYLRKHINTFWNW